MLILGLTLSGCSWFKSSEEKTAEELISDGMYNYEDGDYRDAISAFEKLKDWYPFNKFTSLAELKIGDCYYHLREYPEAIAAYEDFERLHPRNEAVPYVIFQIGTCYFEQIQTVDRDQSVTQKALDSYLRLTRQFPDSEYVPRARERIKDCQKSLSGHEFYIGIYYFKNKRYEPALNRFKTVLSDYPDVGLHQQALSYISLCEQALQSQKLQEKNAGVE